jgi:hypothetical protein
MQLDSEAWSVVVRRLEAGFFVKEEAPLHQSLAQFSIRVVPTLPVETPFVRLRVEFVNLPSSSADVWVICTAPRTVNGRSSEGVRAFGEVELDAIRSLLIAALPSEVLCFTLKDHDGFARVVGPPEHSAASAAAVAVVKYSGAWDDSDPILIEIADRQFAISVGFTENDYPVIVRPITAGRP